MSEQGVWRRAVSRRSVLTGLGLAAVAAGLSACKAGDFSASEPGPTFTFDVTKDKRTLVLGGIADENLLESTLVVPDPADRNSYITPRQLALRIAARRRDTAYACGQLVNAVAAGITKLPSGLTYLGMNSNTSDGYQFGIAKAVTVPDQKTPGGKGAAKTFQITGLTANPGAYPLTDIIVAGQKKPITDWSEFDGYDNLLMLNCIDRNGKGTAKWESEDLSHHNSDSEVIPGWPGKQGYDDGPATSIGWLLAMDERERMLTDFIRTGAGLAPIAAGSQ